ncbi:DUF4231 domain-containing protein [Reichenbachiella sp. MALMAid0571]|uniref:DUF4231 domain-containing protein n=1 Tax=Reichenbachiella sp. MALMAid0571 TaxID=3143939 RepID=UPI0032DE9010
MTTQSNEIKISSEDYPSLYQSANNASLEAQNNHLTVIRSYLILLFLGSVLTIYADKNSVWAIIGALVFLGTLSLTIFQSVKRFDRIWYNGRAVAESVKTRAWRYMMRAEPYFDAENVQVVRASLRNDLREILKQNMNLGVHLGDQNSTKDIISEKMNLIRALSLDERIEIYKRERIDNQRNWYANKAGINRRVSKRWFIFLIVVHVAIITLLLIQIKFPDRIFPTESLIVIAGGIITWIQVKKYQDLTTAYSLTAHEIGIVKGESESIRSEEQFSDFVKDAENAFSREHTQWIARKDS